MLCTLRSEITRHTFLNSGNGVHGLSERPSWWCNTTQFAHLVHYRFKNMKYRLFVCVCVSKTKSVVSWAVEMILKDWDFWHILRSIEKVKCWGKKTMLNFSDNYCHKTKTYNFLRLALIILLKLAYKDTNKIYVHKPVCNRRENCRIIYKKQKTNYGRHYLNWISSHLGRVYDIRKFKLY